MESPLSLIIVAIAICLSTYLVHRVDVAAKKAGWIEDDK
ncbi:hypothetical protein SAMN04488146_13311 [Bacillus nitratireducens]|nr:hypothetical protein SAMN04488146_13311 [Bacillus nitratireducens]